MTPKTNQGKKLTTTEKVIVFDSGVLISFSMNGITDLIKKLKGIFRGKFLITREIKKEVIDTPLKIKRFSLEALKLKELLDEGVLELPDSMGISDEEISEKTRAVMETANTSFYGGGRDIHLIDIGESSCIALSKVLTERGIKNVMAVDERTTRSLIEEHENQRRFLERKFHVKININHDKVDLFNGFSVIRSPELVYVAYKKGLVEIKDHGNVLDALLYAMKFKGASISDQEIEEIKKIK